MIFPNREIVAALRAEYPAGTRVKLLKMDDIQAPPIGTLGTVFRYRRYRQYHGSLG